MNSAKKYNIFKCPNEVKFLFFPTNFVKPFIKNFKLKKPFCCPNRLVCPHVLQKKVS